MCVCTSACVFVCMCVCECVCMCAHVFLWLCGLTVFRNGCSKVKVRFMLGLCNHRKTSMCVCVCACVLYLQEEGGVATRLEHP